jgi:tetratricopeptide (TPR) repeat protein
MRLQPMRDAWLAACLLSLLAGCGKFGGPKTYEEAMKAGKVSYAAGDIKKTWELCSRALEIADKLGNGSQAIWALECVAETAAKIGKADYTLPGYAKVIGTYPKDLANTVSRFRLRNDYAMALYAAGKEDQAMAALAEALTVYKGSGRAGWDTVWERMHLVRNLAKIYAKKGASAQSAAFALEWADEIEANVARNGNAYALRLGSGAALEALADLISINNDPGRAAATRAIAIDQKEGEAEYLAANPTAANRCHKIGTLVGSFTRCFVDLP